uniref:Myb-like domain-containing protein n=1 Tax=Kwoniella pini CBS 10737 TaxID=1296096 RepID=A0A1B9I1E8_9TREE|nr:uncharacterized protein I206_04977 [Kwoniella pini CBS 10737]OCF49288.1 hypothetical protein I206_04977 [Kwoniella pini CBS 10737]
MSTASSSSFTKDRKRSAHWTDQDTETLVNLLLRHKDIGRTADNGFKPEIWEEASMLLEGNTYMGGPKTADACKSRWQRLQRDFKAAKDMEAMPGFSWDRNTNRLSASPECWTNAETQLDSYKYRKINLPTFDSIAILCTNLGDPNKTRPRAAKGRTSLGSISNASSMLSLSTQTTTSTSTGTTAPSQASNTTNTNQVPQNHLIINGNGQDQNNSDAMVHIQQHLHHQNQTDQNVFNWTTGTNGNGEGDFENAFSLPDGSQPFNLGQKRPLPFDPSLLSPAITTNQNQGSGPPQNIHSQHTLPMAQGSPPKKPRPSKSHPQAQQNQPIPTHMQNQHQIHHIAQHLPQAHTIPQQFYTLHPHPHAHPHFQHPSQTQIQVPNQTQHQPHSETSLPPARHSINSLPRSPEFPSSATLLNSRMTSTPPGAITINRHYTPNTLASNHDGNHTISTSQSTNSLQSLSLPVELVSSSGNNDIANKEVDLIKDQGQLSESQRRTNAIIQLQNQQENLELKDEELIEAIVEFEQNVNAADTFLAIQKDHLRKMWLAKIVKRRMGGGRKK